ncbi:MAG: hypothetical protein JST85_02160 [Acidobacteria bacterium]|nr:hypothetical protein [Acidobacteriota bacterium]
MKRLATLFSIVLVIILIVTVVVTGKFAFSENNINDKHINHNQTHSQGTQYLPTVDGSKDPSLIPDVDAQEILFKFLSSANSNDKYLEQRKRSFLTKAGFNDGEIAAITYFAHEYKRLIDPLDAQVESVKMQYWPNPGADVKIQLRELQKQKETIIANSVLSPLKTRLNANNQAEKFNRLIASELKRKTKGFAPELPKKISKLGSYFSKFFSVSAQAFGCDTYVYIYTDTWVDYSDGMVYCNNYYSAPYDNCGHQYTLSFTMDNQTNPYLSLWGGDRTGLIQTFVDVGGYCPIASQSFPAGNNYSEATVGDYIEVGSVNISNNNITSTNQTSTVTINYSYTASAAGKTFRYTPGCAEVSGITCGASGTVTVSPSTVQTPSCCSGNVVLTYSWGGSSTGTFKPYCVFESGLFLSVLGSPKSVTGGTINVN